MITSLFRSDQIEDTIKRFAIATQRRINIAFRFRNALHAFLRDVERAQWEDPPVKILAVDTSEIISAVNYGSSNFSAFTFGGLLSDAPQRNNPGTADGDRSRLAEEIELKTLDRLILQHLLEGRTDRFLLLDDHADEVMIIRNALMRDHQKHREMVESALLENFGGFTIEHLERVRSWIQGNREDALREEWHRFRRHFLPNWRDSMRDTLNKNTKSLNSIDDLISNAKYVFTRPQSAGDHSLVSALARQHRIDFDWTRYESYTERQDVQKHYGDICDIVDQVAVSIRKKRPQDLVDQAARRDAHAFAQMHLLNCFFHEERINARVELVTRSPTLHDIIAALPPGHIRVTLRHPLLMPDIYRFDAEALAAIGGVLQRVDGLIRPYMDDVAIDAGENAKFKQNLSSIEDEKDLLKQVATAARQAIPLLRDVLTVQQGLEQSQSSFKTIIRETVTIDADPSAEEENLIQEKIKDIFEILSRGLRERSDPFSSSAIRDLADQNKKLIAFERRRTFAQDDTFSVRLLYFSSNVDSQKSDSDVSSKKPVENCRPIPELRYAVRPVGPAFGRLFHLYSESIAKFLEEKRREIPDNDTILNGYSPTEVPLRVDFVLDQLDISIDKLREKEKGSNAEKSKADADEIVYHLGATLLACLAFASRRKFETAINIASTILHHIIEQMRRGSLPYDAGNLRRYLAYRELFLFRHYCERCVAMDEYFSTRRSFNDSKGAVPKNFARAQRDLDFAAFMSEAAERCHSGYSKFVDVPPAGASHFKDFRLRLTHTASMIDQYLILAMATKEIPPESDWLKLEFEAMRSRLDIWTAAGLVKESVTDAFYAREQVKLLKSGESAAHNSITRRYFAHIEARALQNALTIFMIFMTFRIAPEMHRLWHVRRTPSPERILVFRDWKEWWERYKELRKDYGFSMRIADITDRFLKCLEEIETMRNQRNSMEKTNSEHKYFLGKLYDDLGKYTKEGGGEETFVKIMATQIRKRTQELIEPI
ncbi:hypothetical protein VH569_05370 [Azospirillum sp. 11R-A]|uniref:hypothetical protein n=1 Tax=Azospirillum sp. 11R-A TaxID=3111634 RepID=UPI003C170BA0